MAARNSKQNNLTSAVAYLRMSDKKQDKSIPAQRAEIERYATLNGYRIVRWYVDEGISGAENIKRLEFQKLILDAQERCDFQAVIVWDQDRFSRFDPMEANYYWFILRQAGVRLVTVATGELDFSGMGGWLSASVAQHGKAQYLRDLSRNVLRGRLNKARAGKWQGNRAPYGYDIVNKGDLVEAKHANVVRRIFREYAESDTSLSNIAHGLNEDGIRGPRSKDWTSTAVRAILRRECYLTGKVQQFYTPKGRFNAVVDGEIVPAGERYNEGGVGMTVECPKLIDGETWERTQRNLKRRTRNTARSPHTKTTVLNGLVICSNCGQPMYSRGKPNGKHADPNDRVYWCSTYHHHGVHRCARNQVHEQSILDYLLPRIQLMLLTPHNMGRLEAALRKQVKRETKPECDLAGARRRLAVLDEDILAAVRELKRVPDDLYDLAVEQVRQLRKERAELKASLERQEALAKKPGQNADERVQAALERAGRLGDVLRKGSRKEVRYALAELVERIELSFEVIKGKRQTRSALTGGVIKLRNDSLLLVPANLRH